MSDRYDVLTEIRRRVKAGQKYPECIAGLDFSYAVELERRPTPPAPTTIEAPAHEAWQDWTEDPG